MVVLTVLMLVAFLCFVPLRVGIAFKFDMTKKCLYARLTLFWMPIFNERFSVQGRYLVCTGTVETNVDLTTVNGQAGINLAKAVVVDSVNVTAAIDYTKVNPLAMPVVEEVLFVLTSIACASTHCRVRTSTCYSPANALFGEVVISVTLAEILLTLVKEKVRIWMNKSAR